VTAALADVARFRADDPAPVVAASFCCPVCLGRPWHVWLDACEPGLPQAQCTCGRCHLRWVVDLTDEQHLRLVCAPPPELAVAGADDAAR